MKPILVYIFISFILLSFQFNLHAQHPCQAPEFRQFDFWLGEWEVYGTQSGTKAGDSRISLILDDCIVLEEWISAGRFQGVRYAGKSYNKYNPSSGQWQQTWVDNIGGSTEYLKGSYSKDKMYFKTLPYPHNKDSMAVRQLSFYSLGPDKVRQHGEVSFDDGKSWTTEYDLEYRRKVKTEESIVDSLFRGMMAAYNTGNFRGIGDFYSVNGVVAGPRTRVAGKENLDKYWMSFSEMGGKWELRREEVRRIGNTILASGISKISDNAGRIHAVDFMLSLVEEADYWKIALDSYWGINE